MTSGWYNADANTATGHTMPPPTAQIYNAFPFRPAKKRKSRNAGFFFR